MRMAAGGAATHIRRDIQGLRAVAVLAVVGDHLLHWPKSGFVGVDVFFVISGYLITDLLLREYERTGSISFVGFYTRRVKRLLPAGMFVLGATTCFSFALLGWSRSKDVARDAIASALFTANWHFAHAQVDYFRESLPPSPLQHYWSLSVEEQFYFIWPWLLLAILVGGCRMGWWNPTHTRSIAGWMIGAITLGSFAWALVETSSHPAKAYFATGSRVWELGLGGLVAAFGSLAAPQRQGLRSALAWLGVVGVVASIFCVPQAPGFPAPWALLPTAATCLVLLAGAKPGGQAPPSVLSNRVAQYLGRTSYSLYLWHFPVVVLMLAVLPNHTLLFVVTCLVLMLGLSDASFRWLESGARHQAWFDWSESGRIEGLSRGWRAYGGVCVAAAIAAAGTGFAVDAAAPELLPAHAVVAVGKASTDTSNCFGAAAMDAGHRCDVNPDQGIAPSPGHVPDDTAGAYDCYSLAFQPMRSCSYGPKSGPTQVALVGDSHAAALLPALRPQLSRLGWRLTTYFGNGCQWRSRPPGSFACEKAMPHIQRALETGDYAVVITTARRSTGVASARDYAAMIRPVVAAGTAVVVIGDVPGIDRRALDCVGRVGLRPSRNCFTPRPHAFEDEDSLAKAVSLAPGARLVRLDRYFCSRSKCPAIIGNVLVYRDSAAHMTATFAKTLSPYLAEAVVEAIPARRNPAAAGSVYAASDQFVTSAPWSRRL